MESRTVRQCGYFLLGVLALLPVLFTAIGEPYYLGVVTRMMIFGIAAMSLDLIFGFAGMFSLGHAVYLGIGGYTVGILSHYGITNGFAHFGAAILCSALVALVIGAVSLRTTGVFFLMITLAFSQMVYFLAISINAFGGDDGLEIPQPSDVGLDLRDPLVLYYVVFAVLVFLLAVGLRIVESRFGMLLRGVKFNESRMIAIGFPTQRYKLAAFVIAGAMCGMAGALLANQTLFVSPSLIQWVRSGELLIMVIAGGMGTLVGSVIGAFLYLFLEQILSAWTVYWPGFVGATLLLLVLLGRKGLLGFVTEWRAPR